LLQESASEVANMTEFWKSNANYWCELCKVWMTDKQSTRATHEAGIKHQELLQKKLRSMRINADKAKSEKKLVDATIDQIESAAAKQYAKDKAAEEAHKAATLGSWALDPGTGYMYNALHRYYFDLKTGMYYGGDPVAWTNTPKIPDAAKYKPETAGGATSGAGAGRTAGGAAPQRRVNIARVNASSHPLGGLGGHSMPSTGTIGRQCRRRCRRHCCRQEETRRSYEETAGEGDVQRGGRGAG